MTTILVVKSKTCSKCKKGYLIKYEFGEDESKPCPRCDKPIKIKFDSADGNVVFDTEP